MNIIPIIKAEDMGKIIKSRRTMGYNRLAIELGMSPEAINGVEKNKPCRVSTVLTLLEALNLELIILADCKEYLITDPEDYELAFGWHHARMWQRLVEVCREHGYTLAVTYED